MARLSLAPVLPELLALKRAPVDLGAGPNALRDAVVAHFVAFGGAQELRVQLCMELDRMLIEDASVRWSEGLSPFVPGARVVVLAQDAWHGSAPAEEDRLAFNPWRGIVVHRSLGSIMRVRREADEIASTFRRTRNGLPQDEPMRP